MYKRLANDARLISLQRRLQNHNIYNSLNSHQSMKLFMERHCFAVWDFFLLLKDLQRNLTNTKRFWSPNQNVNLARFINEIVVGEETDITPIAGEYLSHFQLYLKAMREIGADTQPVSNFVEEVSKLTENESTFGNIERLILAAQNPSYVKKFNLNTCQAVLRGSVAYTAGQFLFGREDPIPQMFRKFVKTLDETGIECPMMKFYLNRHIELDGDSHGPMTILALEQLIGTDEMVSKKILEGAYDAIQHRIILWDGILEEAKVMEALKRQTRVV